MREVRTNNMPGKAAREVPKDIHTGFSKLFQGLGILKGYSYRISLIPDYHPTCIYMPRKIPIPLRDKTKKKRNEMYTARSYLPHIRSYRVV